MKIRTGFVSNSSSSSFIIATKGKLTKELLEKHDIFKTGKESVFYNLAKTCSDILSQADELSLKEFLVRGDYDNLDNAMAEGYSTDKEIAFYIKNGWTAYEGCVSDDSGDYEDYVLCNLSLDYVSDELIVKKDAGY